MVAGTFTLIIEANATLDKIFELLDEDSVPIDISAYTTWAGSIRESYTGSVVASLTVILDPGGDPGKISVKMSDDATLALQNAVTFKDSADVWEGIYDIIGDTGSISLKPVKGKVQLHRAVTTT